MKRRRHLKSQGKKSPVAPAASPPTSAPLLDLAELLAVSEADTPSLARSRPPASAEVREWYRRGAPENPNNSDRDLISLLCYGASFVPYTTAWTDNRIEQVRHFRHWIYVCVNKIARKVSSQYPNVSWVRDRRDDHEKERLLGPHFRTRALTPLLTHEELEPVETGHPLLELLLSPNDLDTADDLFYETVLFLLLTGSAYWWIPKNAMGLPSAIWVVPSHWMWPVMGQNRAFAGWELRPTEGNYMRKFLPDDEVVTFRFKNPISKIDGYSPLTATAQWADVMESMNKARWFAYRNGTFPTVSVEFDGSLNDPTQEQIRTIEARFLSRMAGETNSNKPLFVPPGVKVRPLTLKASEMVFGETSIEMRDNICAAFGVPVELVDIKGDTLKAESAFYSQTVNPLCHLLGQVISTKVGRRYPQDTGRIRVWWEQFSVNDPELLNENTKVDLLCAAVTPNERRVMMGREPYTGDLKKFGDSPIRPVNVATGSLPGGGDHIPDSATPTPDVEQPAINDDDYKAVFDRISPSRNGTHP